ncbi:release factor glutamine methyltransferase [Polymorphobacter fuscus]|uniref:Release factor glutamine methyltransferase n=1 Tax=Sandarakinorhabdus fusca TaxID=1439888 RepID=A0A7C9GNQ6_9SPHN|nr:peptide chain release factor N(5)-glutamine methyltransferase [Polymorphobacter fuscus]KAB7648886.1 peptide chain release factor N(5)-glutamine methyltransferase [Polymorphobacter fuscus]MQT16473.1 peptide chain release factor N(5)-glutamine methyltransferase [Polymorphobacter fuscus]NJC07237.1 release factor glutamine methyltransferase [Polymorphobacter fuscus]
MRDALRSAAARIDRFDAEVLLAHFVGISRGDLLLDGDRAVDAAAFAVLVDRRAAHEPVAYIIGAREFWSLDLKVTPAVLIPRPDSETLVEAALRAVARPPARLLDLGTGSGALLLAGLTEWPAATGLGVDASPAALAVAADNATRLGLGGRAAFRLGDWGAGLDERFDVIFCNPPYVETGADLAPDVRDHEPASALFAGIDGLDDYRRLVPHLPRLLADGGVAVVEIGWMQADAVLALAAAAGLHGDVAQDLAGRDRCLVLRVA